MGWTGHLHCLNASNGDVFWQKDLAKEYPDKEIICNASPLLDGDRLIAFLSSKSAPGVVAVDQNTGKEVGTGRSPSGLDSARDQGLTVLSRLSTIGLSRKTLD
jgi:outer membrane protein assembly factor BamB